MLPECSGDKSCGLTTTALLWKPVPPIITVIQINDVWKLFVPHIINRAVFWARKQQLCTIFRTRVNDQSRAIKYSVSILPNTVHGGSASHGIIFTIQPWMEKKWHRKLFENYLFKRKIHEKPPNFKLPWLEGTLHESRWAAMITARKSNCFGMHAP